MSKTHHYFAPCPRGLEALLTTELTALGMPGVEVRSGGAAFRGDLRLAWRANLGSRLASRVLLQVAHFPYGKEQDIYDGVLGVDWPAWFALERRIRVDVNAVKSPVKSLDFITLRIKDAVCDRFRKQFNARPSVDVREPDVRIQGFLDATHCTVYLDTSGEPLFKRGYRADSGEAPLKENLAAGILLASGWDRKQPLFDPMCGSGTLLIEAAMLALDMPPGAQRAFGFEKLAGHDAAAWDQLRRDTLARAARPRPLDIYGSDISGPELRRTRENLTAAGLDKVVLLQKADVLQVPAPAPAGMLVTNPPYGVRLGETQTMGAPMALEEFYPKLGDAFKAHFAGWTCHVFSGDPRLAKLIGLKASKRFPLFNGPLECRLYEFRMVAGSARKQRDGEERP